MGDGRRTKSENPRAASLRVNGVPRVLRLPSPVSCLPSPGRLPLGSPRFVCCRAVYRRDRDVDEPQVDGELAAMMDEVIDGRPDRLASRTREQHAVAVLE